MNDIIAFEENIRKVKNEESAKYIPAFRSSIHSVYSKINKIEDNCNIDTRDIKWSHSGIFDKIDKMEGKDSKKFNELKSEIFSDLGKFRHGIVQKISDC